MTKTILSWVLASVSIFGMVLNINKNKWCFGVFAVTNFSWLVYFIYIKEYAPAFLQFVFLLSSFWGLWKWHKESITPMSEGK